MVTYIFWITSLGGMVARVAHSAASTPPSHTPRRSARDLLLYNYWLAQLATRETQILVHIRDPYRRPNWV